MRASFLPFARPSLVEEEIREVDETICSGWLTTGPKTEHSREDQNDVVEAVRAILAEFAR